MVMYVHKPFSHQCLKQLSLKLIFCLSELCLVISLQQDVFSRNFFVLLRLDYVVIISFLR